MINEEGTLKIQVNDLIVLCHILDKYSEFKKNLEKLLMVKNNKDIVYQLWRISKDSHCLLTSSIKVKKFYMFNKETVKIVNKYSSISDFITYNYDYTGIPKKDNNLDYFYRYLLKNRNQLDKILKLLHKIKELGFETLRFNPNQDFTGQEYNINSINFNHNMEFVYLDNIVAIPNYERDVVKYKSVGSNYKLVLNIICGEIVRYKRGIVVNSLLFDPKRLPESLSREKTFDKIVKLKHSQEKENTFIQDSVNLSVSIDDLNSKLNAINVVINGLQCLQDKQELRSTLFDIERNIEKLRSISNLYDSSISKENPLVTDEVLKNEKKLYKERRDWMNFN